MTTGEVLHPSLLVSQWSPSKFMNIQQVLAAYCDYI